MILVRTAVLPSSISELGLLADEDISQGTVIWEFNEIIEEQIILRTVLVSNYSNSAIDIEPDDIITGRWPVILKN